jgi:SAM-dependent methyltransferase
MNDHRETGMQSDAGRRQADHYDRILTDYDRHYYDEQSQAYREEFILSPLLEGCDLTGYRVADLASGSGETSLALMKRFPKVLTTGFDISPSACEKYRAAVGRPCFEADLSLGYNGGECFDAAIIMGGLHHCISNLPATLATVAGMIKPGGDFFMFEPNKEYFLQWARRVWYGMDKYFEADTEDGLIHADLLRLSSGRFECRNLNYFGGPAFFLIYNSLVFRVPHTVKRGLSPALMSMERLYNRLPGRLPYTSFVAHWKRTGVV